MKQLKPNRSASFTVIFFFLIIILPMNAPADLGQMGPGDLTWMVGMWSCDLQASIKMKENLKQYPVTSTFRLRKDPSHAWLQGVTKASDGTTYTYFTYDPSSKKYRMVFVASDGTWGSAKSSRPSKGLYKFQGESHFGKYKSKFSKSFKRISKTVYEAKTVLDNKKQKYKQTIEGRCRIRR